MGKNQYISFAIIIGLVIAVSIFFRDPAEETNETIEIDEETLAKIEELEQEVADLHVHIDELNKEYSDYRIASINEKAALQQDQAAILHEMFYLYEMLVDSEVIMDYHHGGAEMKYKEMGSNEIVYMSDYGDGRSFNLIVISRGSQYGKHLFLSKPSPEDGINWTTGASNTISHYGGMITDQDITRVMVYQPSGQQQATIKEMEDGTRIWYASFDEWENQEMTIEALDKEGNLLWHGGWKEGQHFSERTDN
ncbi:MAG: hypothetical protein LRY73_12415 [Bacillus sp. (in: Bacteria)]|nr:hypothetical protein [Bacillus sp. (in: firmicutes)]